MRRSKQERERERAGDAKMFRAWKAFHREQRDAALAGPYATTLGELFRMFANIECVQPTQLIGFIGAIDWGAIDYQTRLTVLHEINSAITAYRTKRGLEPIDDNLPGDPDTPFRAIKAIVLTPSPHARAPTEAKLGPSKSLLQIRGKTA
jgi:hypothetical protein